MNPQMMESGSPFVYYPCLLLCGNQTIAKKLWPATLVFWPTVNDAPACRVPGHAPRCMRRLLEIKPVSGAAGD